MAFTIPGFVVVVFVLWYSVGVWRSTDRYFRDEYKRHLREQYERNKYLKEEEIRQLLDKKNKEKMDVQGETIKDDIANGKADFPNKFNAKIQKESDIDQILNEIKVDKKPNKVSEDDWIEDNEPPSRESECHLDNEHCKIPVATKVNSKIKYYDYTDDEFCFLNGNSEKYCNP